MRILYAIALTICLWLTGSGLGYAQSVNDLQNYQRLVDTQRKIIQKQQQQINLLSKPAEDRLEALRQNVKATDAQIESNLKRLKESEESLKELQSRLDELEYVLQRKRTATTARLRYMQRQQTGRWWALLLDSRNINEFADRRRQLGRVYAGDRVLLSQLKKSTDEVEKQRDKVAVTKNEISILTQKLAYQRSNLEAEAEAQTRVVIRLKSDRRALEQAEDRLAQDSRQITSLILAKSSTPGILLLPGTGQMMYPVVGPITSPFGWRMHPILGYERFHSGMDFGADYGSMIYAADSGTVIFAGWYGGYGNAVIIDHGKGITTLYGHSSEMYVREGQTVQKGQPIAAVGSTGFSTGPHLHFEVRSNGEPTDPATYLG